MCYRGRGSAAPSTLQCPGRAAQGQEFQGLRKEQPGSRTRRGGRGTRARSGRASDGGEGDPGRGPPAQGLQVLRGGQSRLGWGRGVPGGWVAKGRRGVGFAHGDGSWVSCRQGVWASRSWQAGGSPESWPEAEDTEERPCVQGVNTGHFSVGRWAWRWEEAPEQSWLRQGERSRGRASGLGPEEAAKEEWRPGGGRSGGQ